MGQRTGLKLALWLGALAAALAWTPAVTAQDVFFTQSGGRGLQNAKMSARVSKVEADTKDLQAEMATIQPFAKKPIITCTNTADKLRWTGNDWLCDSETDPTVQAFAKKALPSCGAGQILSASGSEFNCAPSGFLSAETDPTVQAFAKSPLPDCGTGKVLSSSGSNLTCIADERGLTQETDPYVHVFARTETAISNCEAGKVLTMQGSRLNCVFDAVGITVETDPKVQPFAKNDIAGYTLNACAAGEVLTAVTQAGVTILKCETGTTVVGPIIASTDLDDLNDVTAPAPSADDVLRFVGGQWVNSSDKIGSLTANKWCHFTVAGDIVCDRDIPAPQPANACAAGQMVTWDNVGKVWSCSSLAAAISETLVLDQLADVSITVPVAGEGLTYTGTGWVNGYNSRIARYDTDVRTMDTSGGLGAVQIVVDGNSVLTASGTSIGIRTNTPTADLDVFGTISGTTIRFGSWISGPVIQASQYVSAASVHTSGTLMVSNTAYVDNLRVNGNTVLGNNLYVLGGLFVSGSQSIDGVVFANGGVSATGTISATRFVGDGSGLTGVAGGDRIVSGTTFAQATEDESITFVTAGSLRAIIGANGRVGVGTDDPETDVEVIGTISATNLHLSGNLTVSGSQIIDGVVFANGGVSATGSITATTFSGDGSGLTNVTANSMRWYGLTDIPAQVVAVSDGTAIQMVGISTTNVSVTANLTAAQVAASTGLFTTVVANSGSFGNVNATGYVSAASLYTSGSALISNTLRADVLRSVGNSYVGNDLYIAGALYVSGSQSIDGVMFANGGVSATGSITATAFSGDGSGLTNVTANPVDRIISGTSNVTVAQNGSVTITTAGGQRVVIGNTGRVGIGVATPRAPLSLIGETSTNGYAIYMQSSDLSGRFAVRDDGVVYWGSNITAPTNRGTLSWDAGYASIGSSAHLVLNPAHNVGIGTTNPNAKLDVNGTISATNLRLSGNLYVSGSQSIDGVVFANGGVSATGTVTATSFSGDGSLLTGVAADWYGLLRIPTQVVAVSDGTAISMQTVSATAINGQYISGTQGYFPVATISALSAGSIGANIVSSSLVSATNVSATLVDATRDGTVSGTYGYFRYISGTSVYGTFVGDGSGLTGVTAGSSDRIVSGTTAVYANNASGYVSFTSGGVTTGWYSPSGIFAAVGVSTTGVVSGTAGYFGGLAVAGNQSLGGTLTGATLVSTSVDGTVSGTYGYFRYISGTSISGAFSGDGSGLTGVTANGMSWYGLTNIPAQVVAVSDGTAITMQTVSASALNAQYVSGSQGYFPAATISALSAGSIGANIVSSSLVSATNVSATLVDATRDGTVSGTYGYFRYISGTSVYGTFVGDGSGLTGVTAGSSDRIVSGTTAVYANNASGYVSFTSGGVTTGWYSPSGIFAAVGVSTTGKVSAVEAFVTGNLGVGITSPNAKVDVDGVVSATGLAITGNQTLSGNLTGPSLISSTYGGLVSATYGYFRNISATYLVGDGSGITNINANAITGLNLDRIVSGTANAIAHQNTGISVSVPLDVAGPVKVAGSGSESCAAGAYGSIRLNPVTGAIQVCRQ